MFLEGTVSIPPRMLVNEEGVSDENPLYVRYEQQDSALAEWLLSTISPTLHNQLVGSSGSSCELWQALMRIFGSHSTTKAIRYRSLLHNIHKNELSMSAYLAEIKHLFDSLAGCGQCVTMKEQQSAILNGLPPEFDHVVSIITTSRVPFDLQGITTALLDAEARQQGHFAQTVFSANVAAAVHKDVPVPSVPSYAGQPAPDMFRSSRGSQSSRRGRGRGRRGSGTRPQCQICGKFGHLARRYFYRYDSASDGEGENSSFRDNTESWARSSHMGRKPIQAYMCCMNDGLHSSYYAHNPPIFIGQASRGSSGSGSDCMHRRSGLISQSICSTNGHGIQSHGSPRIAVPSTVVDPAWYPDSGATTHMTNDSAKLSDARLYNGGGKDLKTHQTLLCGSELNGLYRFDIVKSNFAFNTESTALPESFQQQGSDVQFDKWHRRLGHPSWDVVHIILTSCNIRILTRKNYTLCNACELGKGHKLPFRSSDYVYTAPLELVVADVWGPAPCFSSGYQYYLSFVDSFSRHTWIYFLKKKSDAFSAFLSFKKYIELQLGVKLKQHQTDGGSEFRSFDVYLKQCGIGHCVSCPHTSDQNGLVERRHRQIVETGLVLLAQASLLISYWADAFATAVYIMNRLLTKSLAGVSPCEQLFGHKPDYQQLRVFGCLYYPLFRPYNHHKL
ncbi:hypothetical protein CXB51_025437 [Gossypium anomalum]|uniref:Integrase catalytic domain-containing protein n=1 Tax=Gossypium anomalum TaxID=47600 RepID=A0A8J5Y1T6_9ROSI|nr:hypothetical protein CXB51_025437 [Gossypium anomalum]